jgi:hypothetical protein
LIAGILANFGLIAAGWFTRFVSYTLAKDNEVLSLQVSKGGCRMACSESLVQVLAFQLAALPLTPC